VARQAPTREVLAGEFAAFEHLLYGHLHLVVRERHQYAVGLAILSGAGCAIAA
jgi:hypothetical protein